MTLKEQILSTEFNSEFNKQFLLKIVSESSPEAKEQLMELEDINWKKVISELTKINNWKTERLIIPLVFFEKKIRDLWIEYLLQKAKMLDLENSIDLVKALKNEIINDLSIYENNEEIREKIIESIDKIFNSLDEEEYSVKENGELRIVYRLVQNISLLNLVKFKVGLGHNITKYEMLYKVANLRNATIHFNPMFLIKEYRSKVFKFVDNSKAFFDFIELSTRREKFIDEIKSEPRTKNEATTIIYKDLMNV